VATKRVPAQLFSAVLRPFRWLLERSVRTVLWLLLSVIYRVRVVGREHLPARGPGLLVINRLSWLDGLFVLLHVRRRVRLVVWESLADYSLLRWLLWLLGAIPINPKAGRRGIVRALREARSALRRGELVGVFAAGVVTRAGLALPFARQLALLTRGTAAPLIPACLDRHWGTVFRVAGAQILWRRPLQVPYRLTTAFGPPLPPGTRAGAVQQAVAVLLADCLKLRDSTRKPAHRQFVRIAARWPLRPCLIDPMPGGKRLNYAETLTAAILLAKRLRPRLGNMQMIGLLLPTVIGGALTNIAVALLGKTAVNLNYTASREAMLSAIKQCSIRQVITARAFRERLRLDLGPGVELIDLEDLAHRIGRFERAWTYLWTVLLPGFVTEYWRLGLGRHRGTDLATVIFSSGTTGDPKGVMLNHTNIAANIEQMLQAIDVIPRERIMAVLPFFHSFGYTVTLWLPLVVGASVVYYPDPRQAKEIGEFCRRFRCTIFVTTPTFLRFIYRRCEPDDFKSVRLLITGSEKLPEALARDFAAKFGNLPLEGYGCTELSPVVSVNIPDEDHGGFRVITSRLGTIGQPLPGVAVKVVDPATEQPLPSGQDGLLLAYGPNVMVGYLNRPEATREVMRDGWYVTGDIARLDEEGFITITDRLSRFSKVAGEMVPHQRIEEAIHAILNTTDRVVAVTGVPDERKGERLVVLHTPLNGISPQQIYQQLTRSGLPNLWLPDLRSFYQVDELPVLGSGKLDLQKVKQLAHELAGRKSG
jgi:acyl-[acyl-carrier-protein]-phospholipid O-acyltransferase/long-chain-fatty-acid--[acyl-carrier-protein] ligase